MSNHQLTLSIHRFQPENSPRAFLWKGSCASHEDTLLWLATYQHHNLFQMLIAFKTAVAMEFGRLGGSATIRGIDTADALWPLDPTTVPIERAEEESANIPLAKKTLVLSLREIPHGHDLEILLFTCDGEPHGEEAQGLLFKFRHGTHNIFRTMDALKTYAEEYLKAEQTKRIIGLSDDNPCWPVGL